MPVSRAQTLKNLEDWLITSCVTLIVFSWIFAKKFVFKPRWAQVPVVVCVAPRCER